MIMNQRDMNGLMQIIVMKAYSLLLDTIKRIMNLWYLCAIIHL